MEDEKLEFPSLPQCKDDAEEWTYPMRREMQEILPGLFSVNSAGGPELRSGPAHTGVVSLRALPLRSSWMLRDPPPSCFNSGPTRQRRELQVSSGKLGHWAEHGRSRGCYCSPGKK
ncbi:hypothetical protein GH733_000746 [Mirounga leonina]|nr:hypothetical protein GH733_000746 [Mirounga leonina]